MIDPKINGPEGDGGIDGVFGALSETLGNLIRAGGDYLHEKFLTPKGGNKRPGSDDPFYKQWGDTRRDPDLVNGQGPRDYRGFEFWPITGIWAVGAAVAVVSVVLLLRKR